MMKRLVDAVSSAFFLGNSCSNKNSARSTARNVQRLDPLVRSALAETLRSDVTRVEREMTEIEIEIANAREQYRQAIEKEQFVDTRARRYRKALEVREQELLKERSDLNQRKGDDQNGKEDDEEDTDDDEAQFQQLLQDWENRMEQWKKDEAALAAVLVTHKTIVANCERIRRHLNELEKKKQRILGMNEKCHDFLAVANDENNYENHNHNNEHQTSRTELELAPCSRDDDEAPISSVESAAATGTDESDVEGGGGSSPTTDTIEDHSSLDSPKVEPVG
jgi:chromosome segregation ATPase